MRIIYILLTTIFVNNYIFTGFLGICPFLGVSKNMDTAIGMGIAVVFVTTISSAVTYFVFHNLLTPLGIQYLQTMVFILIVAALVQFLELLIQKTSPALYDAMGVFLPLITVNCVVMAVMLVNVQSDYTFVEAIVNAVGASLGFFLALILLSGVREKLVLADVPKALDGVPIALVSAGLMAIAFMGFSGM